MREANSIVPNVLKINLIIIVSSWKPQLYENHRFNLCSHFRLHVLEPRHLIKIELAFFFHYPTVSGKNIAEVFQTKSLEL